MNGKMVQILLLVFYSLGFIVFTFLADVSETYTKIIMVLILVWILREGLRYYRTFHKVDHESHSLRNGQDKDN